MDRSNFPENVALCIVDVSVRLDQHALHYIASGHRDAELPVVVTSKQIEGTRTIRFPGLRGPTWTGRVLEPHTYRNALTGAVGRRRETRRSRSRVV
jgi:hypothetical protein